MSRFDPETFHALFILLIYDKYHMFLTYLFGLVMLTAALSISGLAAYFSILGLAAIYPTVFWSIVWLGTSIEVGKLVATVWMHQYWSHIPRLLRTFVLYPTIGVMLITSIGVFGFLSKAHIDQSISSGDNTLKIQIVDRKITRQESRIKDSEIVLGQLDKSVAVLQNFDRIRGRTGAIATREKQKTERAAMNKIIDDANTNIENLANERLVFATQQNKLVAEVGPVRFIAELIYGENASRSLLEKAVRWLTIFLVSVFDPFALALLIAASWTFSWARQNKKKVK